jgi:hypothetical protein
MNSMSVRDERLQPASSHRAMPRQIIIEYDYGCDRQSLYPRVLDFNESLFGLARDDKWISLPLSEIDKTAGQLASQVRSQSTLGIRQDREAGRRPQA